MEIAVKRDEKLVPSNGKIRRYPGCLIHRQRGTTVVFCLVLSCFTFTLEGLVNSGESRKHTSTLDFGQSRHTHPTTTTCVPTDFRYTDDPPPQTQTSVGPRSRTREFVTGTSSLPLCSD